jgi:hypothetical protein
MRRPRRSQIAASLGIFLGIAYPIVGIAGCGQREDKPAERSEKLADQCWFLRGTLLEIRDHLWSPDPKDRHSGEGEFHLQASEWQEARPCVLAGISVGGDCAAGDRACMLHSIDWALVVMP